MAQDNDDTGGFKIIDKRRFDDHGEAKSQAKSQNNLPKNEATGETASAKVGRKSANDTARPAEDVKKSAEGEPVDFSSFVISLATQALMMLGEMPHPETQQIHINLDAARNTIDILEMLNEKTKGNLTSDEDRLLGEVLASLQLVFVRKIKENKSHH